MLALNQAGVTQQHCMDGNFKALCKNHFSVVQSKEYQRYKSVYHPLYEVTRSMLKFRDFLRGDADTPQGPAQQQNITLETI